MEKKIGNKEDFQKDENEQGKNFKKERKKRKNNVCPQYKEKRQEGEKINKQRYI